MKIAVICDSTGYIPKRISEKLNIYTIPLSVILDSGSYNEDEEISQEAFFQEVRRMDKLPTTSQPSVGDYILLLNQLKLDGYTDVISVHLSSKISGTCANAELAGESVDGINVHIIDSEIACLIQGFLAIYAAENKDKLPLDVLLTHLYEMRKKENSNGIFMIDTLTNLQKGGRLSNGEAFIGNLLKVKPILEFQNAEIVAIDKVRTKKKALKKIESKFDKEIKLHRDKQITATVIHSNSEEEAQKWQSELARKYPHVKFVISTFGPVIATHLGEGALGLGYTTYKIDSL